jgi:hypothetical protein
MLPFEAISSRLEVKMKFLNGGNERRDSPLNLHKTGTSLARLKQAPATGGDYRSMLTRTRWRPVWAACTSRRLRCSQHRTIYFVGSAISRRSASLLFVDGLRAMLLGKHNPRQQFGVQNPPKSGQFDGFRAFQWGIFAHPA